MRATGVLLEEHQGVRLMLDILDEICNRLQAGKQARAGQLGQIVEFFRIFVDKCHHAKEEDILFPEMEKAGVANKGGPLGALLAEHEQGRGYVRNMGVAVAAYQAGDKTRGATIVALARQYSELLSRHIKKEDEVLYPMADKMFSEKQQQEMAEEFARIESERLGAGTHEKFHALLQQLQAEYLG